MAIYMKKLRLISIGLFTALTLFIFNYIVGNWHQISLLKPAKAEDVTNSLITLSSRLYKDSKFEIGIIEDYQQKIIAGVPVFESPEGNLAYTVVVKPQVNLQQLDNQTLAIIAINEFARGEDFKPQEFQIIKPGEIALPWSGSLTINNNTQPISGIILARQIDRNVFLLLISATDAKTEKITQILQVLSKSLKAV
ncbi:MULTISPECIES: hypothetical protein [unclassified Okeania]|uniref:hypothetical protein n=2 Tax=Okeania TaxID=1458928 RepID=UPI0013BDE449|nr:MULTISPECIES: hypothetical protein [unclassified Okeania]NET19511.1 hypothetical protein [Okeania sp. SIO1H5]NEP71083.1 hypothetical protein [Okeania sp. SIO2G5]NEP91496.1 hypothetical protein [Okeania sp. SIO2F5]NEQ89372.1 hypothetical protein [Okeania sp. SIO2G4]NET76497.1 hypothetical protein [Okeania sp. SIO1F9]